MERIFGYIKINIYLCLNLKIMDDRDYKAMNKNSQKQPSRYTSCIRAMILGQAITFLFSSIIWWINDDMGKWFTRWALGMLLLSAWGIMKHLSNNYR